MMLAVAAFTVVGAAFFMVALWAYRFVKNLTSGYTGACAACTMSNCGGKNRLYIGGRDGKTGCGEQA